MKTVFKSYFFLIALSLLLPSSAEGTVARPRVSPFTGQGRFARADALAQPRRDEYDQFITDTQAIVERDNARVVPHIRDVEQEQQNMMAVLQTEADTIAHGAQVALLNLTLIKKYFLLFLDDLDEEFNRIKDLGQKYFELGRVNEETMNILKDKFHQLYYLKQTLVETFNHFNDAGFKDKLRLMQEIRNQQMQLAQETEALAKMVAASAHITPAQFQGPTAPTASSSRPGSPADQTTPNFSRPQSPAPFNTSPGAMPQPLPIQIATAPAQSMVPPQRRQPGRTNLSPQSGSPQGGATSSGSNRTSDLFDSPPSPSRSSSASSLHLSPTSSSNSSFSGSPLRRTGTQLFEDDSDDSSTLRRQASAKAFVNDVLDHNDSMTRRRLQRTHRQRLSTPHSSSSDVTSTSTSASGRPLHPAVVEFKNQQAKTSQRARSNWHRGIRRATAQAGQFNTATDFGDTPSSQFATAVSKTVANQKQANTLRRHVTVTSPLQRTGSFSSSRSTTGSPTRNFHSVNRQGAPTQKQLRQALTQPFNANSLSRLNEVPSLGSSSTDSSSSSNYSSRDDLFATYDPAGRKFLNSLPSSRAPSPAPTSSFDLSAAEEDTAQKRCAVAQQAVREYAATQSKRQSSSDVSL